MLNFLFNALYLFAFPVATIYLLLKLAKTNKEAKAKLEQVTDSAVKSNEKLVQMINSSIEATVCVLEAVNVNTSLNMYQIEAQKKSLNLLISSLAQISIAIEPSIKFNFSFDPKLEVKPTLNVDANDLLNPSNLIDNVIGGGGKIIDNIFNKDKNKKDDDTKVNPVVPVPDDSGSSIIDDASKIIDDINNKIPKPWKH